MYTASLDGYLRVQNAIHETSLAMQIVPLILDECFRQTSKPMFGDISIFYNHSVHVHAGVYIWNNSDGDPLILSKPNSGVLPLDIKTENQTRFNLQVKMVLYWTPKGGRSLNLEKIYL